MKSKRPGMLVNSSGLPEFPKFQDCHTRSGPVFCLMLRVSSDSAQSITGQVTEVTCPVIGRAQPELTLSKSQKTGPGQPFWILSFDDENKFKIIDSCKKKKSFNFVVSSVPAHGLVLFSAGASAGTAITRLGSCMTPTLEGCYQSSTIIELMKYCI